VRRIPTGATSIPEEVDVLMLVHPKNLSEPLRYAIDQFVLRGGRMLAFVDPNSEADQSQVMPGMPPLPQASHLGGLLEAWGVKLDPTVAVGDLQLALRVRSQQGEREVTADYPPWMNIPSELQSPDDIVTANIGNLTFASPGALVPVEGATTTFAALVRSTESAMLIKNELIGPMADIESLKREYKPAGESFVLAARIQGPAKSAFEAPPPLPAGEDAAGDRPERDAAGAGEGTPERAPHLAQSTEDINVIVIADTDLLQDEFWVQAQSFLGQRIAVPIAANANLVVNALENLSGSADLISVRSRGRFLRPFTRVNELRQAAELKFREKEVQLLERLQETEQRLEELQKSEGEAALVLTDAQRQAIESFRLEKVRIRKELREVRRELRKDIESLEGWLKFANIGLVPILIGIGGTVIGAYRIRRRRARPSTT